MPDRSVNIGPGRRRTQPLRRGSGHLDMRVGDTADRRLIARPGTWADSNWVGIAWSSPRHYLHASARPARRGRKAGGWRAMAGAAAWGCACASPLRLSAAIGAGAPTLHVAGALMRP